MALADRGLQLLHHLLVQWPRTRDRHFNLTSRRAHQGAELFAYALQNAQTVVVGQRVEKVLHRVALILHPCAFLDLGDYLVLVRRRESWRGEDVL